MRIDFIYSWIVDIADNTNIYCSSLRPRTEDVGQAGEDGRFPLLKRIPFYNCSVISIVAEITFLKKNNLFI